MTRHLFCLLLCALIALPLKAIKIPDDHIFVFERSTNTNYVCYDINLDGDRLNQKEPISIYWVLGNATRIEDLTFLDKRMAFGIKVHSISDDEATVSLIPYKKLPIRIFQHKGKWVGVVRMNGHDIIIERLYAQMKSGITVHCEHVDVFGTDLKTGKKCRERIKS